MSNTPRYTPDQVALMIKMAKAGASGSDIGRVIGATRNAISGKMHRMGIPLSSVGKNKPSDAKPRLRKQKKTIKPEIESVKDIPMKDKYLSELPKTLLDVGVDECRYIRDDSLCCADKTPEGKSWCEHHMKIVYTKSYTR